MTHTEQFIEDVKKSDPELFDYLGRQIELYLVNPQAWRAVGKTRGWDNGYPDEVYEAWDHFFSNLYEGLSIEEALAAIA